MAPCLSFWLLTVMGQYWIWESFLGDIIFTFWQQNPSWFLNYLMNVRQKNAFLQTEPLHILLNLLETCILAFQKNISLPNALCGAMLGAAVGCPWFTVSSPWQHAEKSSCLPFPQYPGGKKINRLRIQYPHSHRSLCWPWPLPPPKRHTIPVVIKHSGHPSPVSEVHLLWGTDTREFSFQETGAVVLFTPLH